MAILIPKELIFDIKCKLKMANSLDVGDIELKFTVIRKAGKVLRKKGKKFY